MRAFATLLTILSILAGLILTGCESTGTTFSKSISFVPGGPQVQLSWSPSTGSPQGYQIFQSTDGADFTQVQTVSSTAATITGLTAGKTYYFKVRAYNQGGNSSYTSSVTVPIPSPSPS